MKPSFAALFFFALLSTKISLHCSEPTADGFLQTDDQPQHHPQTYHHNHRQFLRESRHSNTGAIQLHPQSRFTVVTAQTASVPLKKELSKSEEVIEFNIA